MTLTELILCTMRDLGHSATPTEVYGMIFSKAWDEGYVLKKGTVKRIMYRLYQRGQLGKEDHHYFFIPEGDRLSYSRGQKGTDLRGMSHLSRARKGQGIFENKWDKGTSPILERDTPLFTRMLAALTSEKLGNKHISPRDFIRGPYLQGIGNPETKRRYFSRLVKYGVLKRAKRGKYMVNRERALKLLEEGRPLRVQNVPMSESKEGDRLITVSHHFRIKKAIPLEEEERAAIEKYLWITEPMWDVINGMLVQAQPTSKRDRSHGVKLVTLGATFYITRSWKKGITKVMIYPMTNSGDDWVQVAKRIFGKSFVDRAIKIGISSHFGLNLDELSKVLYEGEEIKVTVNKSDFGASGDLEFEGVTEDGAKLARQILETKLEAVGEVVDAFESVKKMIAEMELRIHKMEKGYDIEDLKKRIGALEDMMEEIKDHVVLHTKYINLVMKNASEGGVEGYA